MAEHETNAAQTAETTTVPTDAPTAEVTTIEAIQTTFSGLVRQGEIFFQGLFRPTTLIQIGVLLAVFVAAHLLAKFVTPRFENWIRSKEGLQKWQLRWLVVVRNRIRGILFIPLCYGAVSVMQEMYRFPSKYYLLVIAANLALAWVIVAFATRLISNNTLRRVVNWAAWIWITLRIIGLDDDSQNILESAKIGLGESTISAWQVLQGIALLAVLFFGARLLTKTTASRVERNDEMSPSMRVLLVKAMQLVLYGAAFFIGMRAVGIDLTGLAVLSGAIGVGLGFGLQKVVSNLVSGVIILLDKSIKPGDVISLGDTFGWINSLGARYVSVVTRNGKEYLIPNEDLITGQVVNWSHSNDFVRLDIYFGTAYGDDPHNVRKLAIQAATTVDRVLSAPRAPVCHIVGFGDSSVDYILRFWISDPTGGLTNVRGQVFLALWDSFKENDISIPFPQREMRVLEGSQIDTKALD